MFLEDFQNDIEKLSQSSPFCFFYHCVCYDDDPETGVERIESEIIRVERILLNNTQMVKNAKKKKNTT